MKNLLIRLWKDEEGQDLTEYALLAVLIAVGAITASKALTTAINGALGAASSNLNTAT